MLAEQINAALSEKLKEKCVIYPQNNLRCSSVGHPCNRYVYLCITNYADRKPPDETLQSIFAVGNALEALVIEKVKEAGYKKVILRPLMVVAGDHANNDMADEEDPESWYSMFTASGTFDDVICIIKGLGRVPEVENLYVAHTGAALQ